MRSLHLTALCCAALLAACADRPPLQPLPSEGTPATRGMQTLNCTAQASTATLTCTGALPGGARASIYGGQGQYVKLTSSNVSYSNGIFSFDVTVQNLMNEAIGTPDGTVADPQGIQVFFASGPTTTSGTGTITVANADGTDTFTGAGQPYFAYNEILAKDAVSSAKTWQLDVPATVNTFTFTLFIETDVQYLLVINEVMANPVGAVNIEGPLEWFEVYNAGTRSVDMQNLVIADSSASGRRPFHLISSSLPVPAGGYVTLGGSTNATDNGGAPIDYAWGTALSLANSLDAVKIARVYGTDTLTIDRTQYSNASVSAVEGVSRELKNPALDNSNMDGSNWAGATVTAVYGSGGRGTPQAQNSTYVP